MKLYFSEYYNKINHINLHYILFKKLNEYNHAYTSIPIYQYNNSKYISSEKRYQCRYSELSFYCKRVFPFYSNSIGFATQSDLSC